MKQVTNIIIFTLITVAANAQTGIYIPKGANVAFFGDSATAFSSIQNNGNVNIASKAIVNFEGQNWTNDAKAQLTGDGTVRFTSKENGAQIIDGGYNAAVHQGASFGTLEVANKGGVEIKGSNAKVRNELKLKNKVTVNDNILVVGNNNPGKISYDSANYVVTNNIDGYLLRENMSAADGKVVFPVGTDKGFSPATIRVKSANADNYYVNVYNGVRPAGPISVNRTWNVGKQNNPGQDSVELTLKHLVREESKLYTENKSTAYVAKAIPTGWEAFDGFIGTVSSFTKLVNTSITTPSVPSAPATPNAEYKLNVWPNPSADKFFISINGNIQVKTILIYNIVGVKMGEKAVNGQNVVEVSKLIPGTYVISFLSNNGNILESRKVVVTGY